jgi:hypothetical protein
MMKRLLVRSSGEFGSISIGNPNRTLACGHFSKRLQQRNKERRVRICICRAWSARGKCNEKNAPLKEHNSRYLLIVLDSPELLPAFDDMTGNVVTEFLNHGW